MRHAEPATSKEGLHVLLLCCAEYQHLVEHCIKLVKKNVIDKILSITIVANKKMTTPDGCRLILDQEFWSQLDPDFTYRKIYNQNWIRQQIFKMYGDLYLNGNILILDPEVMFLRPTKWIHDTKVDLYVNTGHVPWVTESHAFVREILGIDTNIIDKSFMSNATIFSSDILKQMRAEIENRNGMSFFDLINKKIINGSGEFTLSEFDIYGYFFLDRYKNNINDIIVRDNNDNEYFHETLGFDENFEKFSQSTNNNYVVISTSKTSATGGETKWLTFYQQIKDPSWPDCDNEEDFCKLPESIQQECIEVFGYSVKK